MVPALDASAEAAPGTSAIPAANIHSTSALNSGAMLFALPRELRDQIYRYVVKGTYAINKQPDQRIATWVGLGLELITKLFSRRPKWGQPEETSTTVSNPVYSPGLTGRNLDLSILFVSISIHQEAMEACYSESIFRIFVNFKNTELDLLTSSNAIKRMMNIELDTSPVGHSSSCPDQLVSKTSEQQEQIWRSTLACITGTDTVRKTLRIRWHVRSELLGTLPHWMWVPLGRLTRFCSVVVEILLDFVDSSGLDRSGGSFTHDKHFTYSHVYKMDVIRKYLQAFLGPAATTSTPDSNTMTFRPWENLPETFWAKALMADAEKLNLKAQRLDLEIGGKG